MKIDRLYFYSSTTRWLILGANVINAQFQILQISKNGSCEVIDDQRLYTRDEVDGIITMAVGANVKPVGSAFGIIGLVRFFNGYYLYHVKSRQKVADLNGKTIYKILKTEYIYLPSSTARIESKLEDKYLKYFNSVDLSTDFYYSKELNLTQPWPQCVTEQDEIESRFSWNHHLTRQLPKRWSLTLIHGFVSSRQLAGIFNSPILILIARRSSEFAGTRFNRRGCNLDGNVANEVETEQIVYRPGPFGKATSFVQHRGSVPLFWSQDMGSVPQKPPIEIDHSDPWYTASTNHFRKLHSRYKGPIIALNLVKHNSGGETSLGHMYHEITKYINQFLPRNSQIIWEWVDIAKLRKEGSFAEFQPLCDELTKIVGITESPTSCQNGVIRVNCVDCLDRTNLTQVSIGLVALELQLRQLEVPLDVNTDFCGSIFQKLFEEHGDIIGYQYGGSQLVHTLKSYRGEDPLASKSKDILATISRYYSNTVSDNEKQIALDVFLLKTHPADRNLSTIQYRRDIYNYLERRPHILTQVFSAPKVGLERGADLQVSFGEYYDPNSLRQLSELFIANLGIHYRSLGIPAPVLSSITKNTKKIDLALSPEPFEILSNETVQESSNDLPTKTEDSFGPLCILPCLSNFENWDQIPFLQLAEYSPDQLCIENEIKTYKTGYENSLQEALCW